MALSESGSVDFDAEADGTFIDKMNANEELFKAMLSMSAAENEAFIESRREEQFSMFWEHLEMSREWVLTKVKAREEDFIDEYAMDELPEWVLRAEAQDQLQMLLADELVDE